jgi:hypothetical protein
LTTGTNFSRHWARAASSLPAALAAPRPAAAIDKTVATKTTNCAMRHDVVHWTGQQILDRYTAQVPKP